MKKNSIIFLQAVIVLIRNEKVIIGKLILKQNPLTPLFQSKLKLSTPRFLFLIIIIRNLTHQDTKNFLLKKRWKIAQKLTIFTKLTFKKMVAIYC